MAFLCLGQGQGTTSGGAEHKHCACASCRGQKEEGSRHAGAPSCLQLGGFVFRA